jgi:hypothetical protein
MTTVWETRHRLLVEQLEQWVDWLSGEEPIEQAAVEEQAVRLLAAVVLLLEQHAVNKRGQCRFCGWTKWKRRFWNRRRRCTVFQAADRAMRQGLDVVWWELFNSVGRGVRLDEVRRWVEEWEPTRISRRTR